jgi:tetratricopeptide (TPR) repeat protein
MNNNFGPGDGDFWDEFNDPNSSWERKAEILIELAMRAGSRGDFKRERTYLESARGIAAEHDLPKQLDRATGIMAHRAARVWEDPELTFAIADEVISQHPGLVPDDEVMEKINSLRCAKATAYMSQERWAEAAYEYKTVLEIALFTEDDMEAAHAHSNLTRIYLELDEVDKAKEHADAAKKIFQDNYQMAYQCNIDRQLARIAILSGNYARAKIELREIRAIEQRMFQSSHPETKMYLGMAYMGLGEYIKAEKLFAKLFDQNTKAWNFAFDYSLEVGALYVDSLQAQGKMAEANRVSFLLKAIQKKAPGAKSNDFGRREKEIKLLSQAGRFDEAEIVSRTLLDEASEAGDLRAHYVAVKAVIDTLWKKKDYEGVVVAWDELSPQALNYYDDLVIPVKNFVTHALLKVGRIEEAKELNLEVMNDFRLTQDQQQTNYANENAARIYKALKLYAKANQFKERSLQGYIELGDNARALEVMKYFGKGK